MDDFSNFKNSNSDKDLIFNDIIFVHFVAVYLLQYASNM